MSWAKFSDDLDEDARLLEVSPAARWLFVASITYSRRRQSAGLLTAAQARHLTKAQGVTSREVKELTKAALWMTTEEGFEVRQYAKYNPLTSTERVRKHRQETAVEHASSVSETLQEPSGNTSSRARLATGRLPVPEPRPVPEEDLIPSPPPPALETQRLQAVHDWAYARNPALTVNENVLVLRRIAREFDLPPELILHSLDEQWGQASEPPRSMRYFWPGLQEMRSEHFKALGGTEAGADAGFVKALA